MKELIGLALVSIMATTTPAEPPKPKLEYQGTFTATEYCRSCNTPCNSTVTASGRFVPGYSVATSEIPLGTIITVKGKRYRVDDTGCPKGRIDFLQSGNVCGCSRKERIKVYKDGK